MKQEAESLGQKPGESEWWVEYKKGQGKQFRSKAINNLWDYLNRLLVFLLLQCGTSFWILGRIR